ncbi:hypothetical protein BH11BAC2_BH11BAC2_01880 [soil metagenome]
MNTMNKTVAGYRMLMILSAVDGIFNAKEDSVIKQYMVESFPGRVNLDGEMEILSSLDPTDYPVFFNDAMNAFYLDSTPDDRTHFLDMAVRLVVADKNVTPMENLFLNELFNAWEANFSF